MSRAILYTPSDEAVDRSLDARTYVQRLSRRLEVQRRFYDAAAEDLEIPGDVESVAVLSGLSALELASGYMEMELDTIFRPQELLGKLREELAADFVVVAVVDDAYSDYLMSAYLKAGASAVVGTSGDLFGVVVSRVSDWRHLFPYMNVFGKV
ncbi:MAG: hypothetical protein AMK73_06410 [Planctomycetes bacterium SM23_32]|nr:MAG: hypothetical protein AMK73_06410 [Planctomycetes bacterium SM23_32]